MFLFLSFVNVLSYFILISLPFTEREKCDERINSMARFNLSIRKLKDFERNIGNELMANSNAVRLRNE